MMTMMAMMLMMIMTEVCSTQLTELCCNSTSSASVDSAVVYCACVRCSAISRSVGNDSAISARTAMHTANVPGANLPVVSCTSQTTKATSLCTTRDLNAGDRTVCHPSPEPQQTVVMPRGIITDEAQYVSGARSLLALNQRPVQPARSTDRMIPESQYTRTAAQRASSVQRSHSFTTTSHQPPPNIGLLSSFFLLLLCVNIVLWWLLQVL